MKSDLITGSFTVEEIIRVSSETPVLIFKHSYRCGISSMVWSRLRNSPDFSELPVHFMFIDVIQDRVTSNQIANHFNIEHESPQVLLIVEGKCIYNESHSAIRISGIKENLLFKNN